MKLNPSIRRLACDAEVILAVLGSVGEVLDVGRTQRLVTAAIWKALVLRDQHCRFPGCRRMPLACDAHHLQHWADGGATALDNLVLLCRAHQHTAARDAVGGAAQPPRPDTRVPPATRPMPTIGIRSTTASTGLDPGRSRPRVSGRR